MGAIRASVVRFPPIRLAGVPIGVPKINVMRILVSGYKTQDKADSRSHGSLCLCGAAFWAPTQGSLSEQVFSLGQLE